jgi:hypothetical protein
LKEANTVKIENFKIGFRGKIEQKNAKVAQRN